MSDAMKERFAAWKKNYGRGAKQALKFAAFIHLPALLLFLESLRLSCFPEGALPFVGAGFLANAWRACALAAVVFFPVVLHDELSTPEQRKERKKRKAGRSEFVQDLLCWMGLLFVATPMLLLIAASFFLLYLAFDIPPLTGTGALHGAFFAAGSGVCLYSLWRCILNGIFHKKLFIFGGLVACACLAFPPVRLFAFMLLAGAGTGFSAFAACFLIGIHIDPSGLAG